ncbi:amino acid permease [Bacillus alkalicellulosilyticus]|uniref:amino acid permease n=1 Tax=Alkalihalobacterium alkalicellulosilyticum TaxID=1912214 RepID=UPI000997726C|nr:amino acid permease [Bacillus alkalicellulosilyticus]
MKSADASHGEKTIKWWQLSLLGVACTIGTGFFLGSSIAINMAGPSVVLAYVLAAIGTYVVFEALAKMTIADPQKGSFRTYAKKAYGRWAGFSSGWVYWASEMLIMGSQLTALSIFTRLWFPNVPLWMLASVYAVLGIIVVLLGSKGFDRIENVLAVIKIAAIVMFIILAVLALFGVLNGGSPEKDTIPTSIPSLFPNGFTGFWSSLIFGFYGYAGIEIMGLLAVRLKKMTDAPKSGKVMLLLLAVIYVSSIGLALTLVRWNHFSTEQSPFITALADFNIPYIPHIFNGVFIIAGFSTMAASLFAVTSILVTLAADRDAPAIFEKKIKNKVALPAICLTTLGIIASIVLALIMPERIYEYVTTAASLMLLYNWIFILCSYKRLTKLKAGDNVKRLLGLLLVLLGVSGTLFHHTSRPGFFVSLMFIIVIAIVTLIMRKHWKKEDDPTDKGTLFTKI